MADLRRLIDELERSYGELQERMSDPSVYDDRREAAEVGRRLKDLEAPYRLAQEWRHAPRPARPRDRVAGADPHLDRDRRGHAGGGGGRGRDRPERPEDRRLPLDRARRAEREHDRLRGPGHPPADRPRRRDAGREVAAPEQDEGAARPAGPALRARARAAAGRALRDAAVADRLGRAGGEDPHLQLPGEPPHRPPDQADGAPARPDPRGRAGRLHGRALGRGAAPLPRVTAREALREAARPLATAGSGPAKR